MLKFQQPKSLRMSFRIPYLLLVMLLAGCASAPSQQQTSPEQPIVNQADDVITEARFSQSLNELLSQISKSQEIPIQSLEIAFLDVKTIPSIRKLVLPTN